MVEGAPPFFRCLMFLFEVFRLYDIRPKSRAPSRLKGAIDFSERWAEIAFAGVGFTRNDEATLETTQDIGSVDTGVRFQALREQDVWIGLDIAKGPEEYAWYIQIGQGW